MNQADMESSLRAVLAERADRVTPNDQLPQQIIIRASSGGAVTHPTPLRRRSWTLPLLTAAAVVALVAGTVTLASLQHSTSPGHGEAIDRIANPIVVQKPTIHPGTSQTPPSISTQTEGARVVQLEAFQAEDLTFTGTDDAWALGSATCINPGKAKRCTALLHSTNASTWRMVSSTPFNVPGDDSCGAPCVEHIRFANDRVGYVYGPSAFFMTVNGGKKWIEQPGGADALETLDGNVIRISDAGGCPPGCSYTVQTAALGSPDWTTVPVPRLQQGDGDGVTLARSGQNSYLMTYGHPTGGAGSAESSLFTSVDDGASWTYRGEPCPQGAGPDGEVDSSAMTSGADGSVVVVCTPRLESADSTSFVAVSTDGGATFAAPNRTALGSLDSSSFPGTVAAATASDICVMGAVLYCSTDGGATFAKSSGSSGGGPGVAAWAGFESTSVGRVLEIGTGAHGAQPVSDLWTTRDGGQSWSLATVPNS